MRITLTLVLAFFTAGGLVHAEEPDERTLSPYFFVDPIHPIPTAPKHCMWRLRCACPEGSPACSPSSSPR